MKNKISMTKLKDMSTYDVLKILASCQKITVVFGKRREPIFEIHAVEEQEESADDCASVDR